MIYTPLVVESKKLSLNFLRYKNSVYTPMLVVTMTLSNISNEILSYETFKKIILNDL